MPNIKMSKNILLAPYTTFKIGGPAKYFYETKNSKEIVEAIKMAKKAKMPYFILGGGSNILVSDRGFDGLVIRIYGSQLSINGNKIVADAGVLLSELVDNSVKAGLTGLEWAAGIPGTVGGAVRGNAGAFNGSMAGSVKRIQVLKIPELKVASYKPQDLRFEYKDSIFKHNKDVILSVELRLENGDNKKSKQIIKEHLVYRDKHQPLEFPSAGCVFKNPEDQHAGYLIEQCGLRGTKIGGAMISKKHGNFIINTGNAKASDVKKLIDLCREKVRNKFGINLEEEIEYLGEF